MSQGNFYLVSEADAQVLRRVVKKLNSVTGNGVTNLPESLAINPLLPGQKSPTVQLPTKPIKFAKVTALKTEANGSYTSFASDKKLASHVTANPSNDAIGTTITTGTTITLKLNELVTANHGLEVAVDDIVAYIASDRTELVPGGTGTPAPTYDGYIIPQAGNIGARIRYGLYIAVPVTMSQTGGDDGNATTAATYTYTLTDAETSTSLQTSVNPTSGYFRRIKGPVVPATAGLAFTDGTNWIVTWCNEVNEEGTCAT